MNIDIQGLYRACARIHELSVSVWLQRARALVRDDTAAWSDFLASCGLSAKSAARYERELETAKAAGEILPWPPMPKMFKLKRHPLQEKLAFIARAVIGAQASADDPDGPPHTSPDAPVPEPVPVVAAHRAVAPVPREQRVYFIQGVEGGPIKIGVSFDPDDRLSGLQTASPVRLRIIGLVAGGPSVERKFHERLAEHRLHGEWFSDAPEVLAAIAEALQ